MPYVSACEASTSRSAAAYARSSSGPVRGPGKRTRPRSPLSRTRRCTSSANAGARSRLPTHAQRQDRSVAVARASSSTSWPLPGVTAATQSSASPAAVPGARRAVSTPGSATCTRSAGSAYSSPSRRRVHWPGHHDGGGRREDLALARVAERHVHEHDLPDGARAERVAPRGPGTRSARRAAPRRRPGSAGRCVRGLDDVLVHNPAERGEPRRRGGQNASPPLGCAGSSMPSGTITWISVDSGRSEPARRDMRLVQRHHQPVEPAVAQRASASRSATTLASASVVVFMSAKSASSSRLR